MSDLKQFLELKIKGCNDLGGMEKEKWAFQTILKELNTHQLGLTMIAEGLIQLDPKQKRLLIIELNQHLAFEIGAKLILSDDAQTEVIDALWEVCSREENN